MVKAWAPGHATLFFAVPNKYDNALEMGSIGGGLNFKAGVITNVNFGSQDKVYWNDKIISGEVSLTCLKLFRNEININKKFIIKHYSELKIGFGLSTSGAGAIGTLLAINQLCKSPLKTNKLYELAHLAEIEHHTGLGSVVGQICSGIELRLSQGSPAISNVKGYFEENDVILVMLGPLKTSKIITSDKKMQQVTDAGRLSIQKAERINNNFVENFIKIGNEFTNECGLLTEKMRVIMNSLREFGEDRVSMAMIGETLVILPRDEKKLFLWLESQDIKFLKTSLTDAKPSILK